MGSYHCHFYTQCLAHHLGLSLWLDIIGIVRKGRSRLHAGAEGATAPVNSQAKGPSELQTLERGAPAHADGITISGSRTEGASNAVQWAGVIGAGLTPVHGGIHEQSQTVAASRCAPNRGREICAFCRL